MNKEDRKNLIKVIGSGGKGGSAREPFEADDNMFARQHAAFIDAIAEGPIKGLVYGDASILVDETRMRDVNQRTGQRSKNPNIQNFRIVEAKGAATQTPNADFFHSFPSAALIEEVGSAELLLNEPQYHTISSGSFEKQNADYIKVTMSTTGMVKITKTGDQAGDRRTTNVMFDIVFRWTDIDGVQRSVTKFATGFMGKVSGKYAHTFGFNIEEDKATNGMVDWALKITRVGGEKSGGVYEVSNSVYIDSIEASIADKLEYPYTAYIAGAIDAEAFSSIPARGYEIDGKLINVPSNHFPIDYNGRKVTVANTTNFAVGDSVKQDGISLTSITAAFANAAEVEGTEDENGDPIDPNADGGYLATATCAAAHGITVGNVFTALIDGVSAELDFWEGTFDCEATTTTQFTYTLNAPATSTTDPTIKTLSSTTAAGTKTATVFTGGLIDKIDGSTTLYLRNVSPTSNILLGSAITNNGSGSANATAVEQVLIPANYRRDASTEKITTVEHDWDGLFYNTWCNNPAWVYNDLITNKIYGLGNYISQNQINKWELYQIGRYCDELVPAGVAAADLLSLYTTNDANYTGSTGEFEPRFSCNLVIAGQQEAFKVLNDVTGIFRGMTYWLNGEAYVVQDSEKDPVYQFTTGNVINGEFKYEGTANKTRTNQVIVNWNNPQDYYRPRAEIVELEEILQKDTEFLKTDSIAAFGCTSRGQARRLGKWKLLSNHLHTNTISFATGINAAFIRPGDIVQVMDNAKTGKSWGGRVKSSSSTSSIKLDRQWEKEAGYNYNDYQVTLTFVGYKALLAQDQATIEVQGVNTALVRGNEITNWRDSDGIIDASRGWEDGEGDITLDSEEKAANVFDNDGNMVFVQWTPFTQTETKFIDASDNADPSSLTISTAGLNSVILSEAPAADSMWIISRSALSTGKTKEEAKLFRILQIAEGDPGIFEIQGLEYNATKFDAVDKNEALSKDRQIFLPSTFKVTPPVTNISYRGTLKKASDSDASIQCLTFSWDPPRNIDDNALYTFVREYEIYYAQDGIQWKHAGNTPNTSIELENKLSGIYHVKIFTKSVQDKRSIPAEAKIEVNFQRAVGPSEGSVGNGDLTINKIGTIGGSYELDAGKVSFSPANQRHIDGRNSHDIIGQVQLDFTGLSHTSTTGGDVGYIYMDHSANAFKAIAHDETSDQFYAVGASVFNAGTGTITCSPSMISTATHTPNHILGLDSPNFDGDLAVDNVLKFSIGVKNYHHRVRTLTSDSEMLVDPPVSVTVVDGDNKGFVKPTFLVDYLNDTVMGMVTKTGASTYVITKFGASQGGGAYDIQGTNESHTFAADSDGEVTTANYAAYSNTYTVERDGTAFTYAASGTTASTFGLTVTAVTGLDATSDVNISGSGVITIDDESLDDADQFSATATVVIKDLLRDYTIGTRIISFTKAGTGADGAAGAGGNNVSLKASHYVVVYNTEGESPTPSVSTDITLTADSAGFSDAYFKFTGDGITDEGSHTNGTGQNQDTFTYPVVADFDNFVNPSTITVSVSEAADSGTVIATDKITLAAVKSGTDAYTVVNTNQAHAIPIDTNNSNAPSYTGSGTQIRVWKGGTLLEAIHTGSVTTGQFKVTASGTGITPNSTNSSHGTATNIITDPATPTLETIVYGVANSISAATAEIEFSIDIEGIQTVTSSQTFNKNADGTDGITGAGSNFVFARQTAKPPTPTANGLNIPSASIQWYDDPPTTPLETLWASKGTVAAGGTAYVWGAVFQVAGNAVAEVAIYLKTTVSSTPSGGSYNFVTNALTAPSGGWSQNIPALSANNDKIYRSLGLFAGDSTATAATTTWSASVLYAQRTDGTSAVNSRYPTLYRKNSNSITNSSGTFTDPRAGNTDWNYAIPAISTNGDIIYAVSRIFTSDSSSPHESAWPTPVIYATRVDGTTVVGPDGQGIRQANLYKLNDTTLSDTDGGTFANPLTGNTDWSFSVPALAANNDKVYVATRTFTSDAASPQDAAWSTPVIYSQRTDGAVGTPAVNSRYPTLYRLNSNTINASSGTFANPRYNNTDWNYAVPALTADGDIVYAVSRILTSDAASPQESAWSTPAIYARRVDGNTITGPAGQGVRQANIYKLNDTTLTSTTGGTFASPLTGNTDWSFDVPAVGSNNDKVYVATRTFTSNAASPQDAAWSTPSIYAHRTDGTPAVNSRYPTLYRLNSNTINASSGTFADPRDNNSDWLYAVPALAADGDIVYAVSRILTSDAASPQESAWSTPAIYARRVDGATVTGPAGQGSRFVSLYNKNDSSLASTTLGSFATPLHSTNSSDGWQYAVPALSADGDIIYVTTRLFTSDGASPQDANWVSPVIYSQRTDGDTGAGTIVIYYLQTLYAQPTAPTNGTDETPGAWTVAVPTAASGKSIWWSVGTKAEGGTTWTFSAAQFYFGDTTYTIPGIFNSIWDLNLNATTLEGVLSMVNGDFVNYTNGELTFANVTDGLNFTPYNATNPNSYAADQVLPTYTANAAAPANSTTPSPNPVGSTWLQTGPDPDVLWVAGSDGAWHSQATINSTYVAGDFAITALGGYTADAFANNSITIDPSTGEILNIGTDDIIVDNQELEDDLLFGLISVTSGSQTANFSTTNGTSYTANNTTGNLRITHPTAGAFDVTYTWTRTGATVSAFALTNTGSGNDAWSNTAFGSAGVIKAVTVTHTASSNTIALICTIIDLSGGGGGGGK